MRDKGAKRPASGKLHIDDGCMGGGTSIPHQDKVAWTNSGIGTMGSITSIEGMWNDDADNNGVKDNTYFTQSRKKIFRYCVIGDEAGYKRASGAPPHGRGAMWGKYGLTDYEAGNFFVIWGGAMTGKYSSDEWWASMWMHELGHTLGLNSDSSYSDEYPWYDSIPFVDADTKPLSDSKYPSCMRYGREKGDSGFIDYSNKGSATSTINVYDEDRNPQEVHNPFDPYSRPRATYIYQNDWERLRLDYMIWDQVRP